jgi:hypothetical protein
MTNDGLGDILGDFFFHKLVKLVTLNVSRLKTNRWEYLYSCWRPIWHQFVRREFSPVCKSNFQVDFQFRLIPASLLPVNPHFLVNPFVCAMPENRATRWACEKVVLCWFVSLITVPKIRKMTFTRTTLILVRTLRLGLKCRSGKSRSGKRRSGKHCSRHCRSTKKVAQNVAKHIFCQK